jgi:UDP:flavonoid glycosyltransferase YjiC (YdhE family)
MRILFTMLSSRPHVYLLTPLAWACRAAGHEVRLAGPPTLAEYLVQPGLPAVLVGGRPDYTPQATQDLAREYFFQEPWPADWAVNLHLLDDAKRAYLDRAAPYLIAVADAMVDDLVALGRHWRPDLIVYDTDTYAGAVAAAVLGLPGVRYLYGTQSVPWLELRLPSRAPGPAEEARPEYARMFERRGAPVHTRPTAYVDQTPPSLRLVETTPRLDMRHVPYNGPGIIPSGLDAPRERPRVCVSWGHFGPQVLGAGPGEEFRDVIEAVTASGAAAMVVTSEAQLSAVGELPATARAFAGVPLQFVLAGCDAIVHHGGDGTSLTGAALGVPQLVITREPGDDLTGGRLAATGAGIHLRRQHLQEDPARRDVIGDALDKLLTDSTYRDAAGRLREEIERQPTPADVVPGLVRLATRR